MTDSCEIDVEVGGSVGISDAEERVVECRRASIVIEESAEKETKRRCAVETAVAWKTFKSILFVICLSFLIKQSVDFLGVYYKYPTNIQLETTLARDFKLPAITLCFRNTISFKEFCSFRPDRCRKPDMEEFCTEHPIHCKGDNSTLMIPMQDGQTRKIMQTYLINDSYNDEDMFDDYKYASKARTFVRDIENPFLYLKCYSENLHLFQSGSKLKTRKLDFFFEEGDLFSQILLYQGNIEPFYPLDTPQVFLAIHSPYVPLNPEEDLHPVKPGVWYNTYVQLEKEEHHLPAPYQTDCRDNGPSKDAKEFTNPNSFQMCLELCRSEFYKASFVCGSGMTMISSIDNLCNEDFKKRNLSSEQSVELRDKRLFCFQNCKQGCLKLQYKSTIKEIGDDHYESYIVFFIKNPEVTVLRHVPLYGSGDIFSHIGGLLGCWLGISVFTFTDIVEKFFRKVVKWKKRFRKEEEQRAPTSEIHQD